VPVYFFNRRHAMNTNVKTKTLTSGKLIRKGKLLVWTGKVPPIPLEVAVRKARHYSR
jgi:hypothetical protein